MGQRLVIIVFAGILVANLATAQEIDRWDNQLYLINKVGWGEKDWKFAGEIQGRFEQNASDLQSYHVELIASYLPNNFIEVVPDFRFTVRPTRVEFRPGFGVFIKQHFKKSRLIHQIKAQYDFENTGYESFGARYAVFYHQTISEKFLGTVFGGGLYEVGELFTDWWGFRAGLSGTYLPDKTHAITAGYMFGAVNTGTEYTYIGIVTIGLIINIKSDNTYSPAKYISF